MSFLKSPGETPSARSGPAGWFWFSAMSVSSSAFDDYVTRKFPVNTKQLTQLCMERGSLLTGKITGNLKFWADLGWSVRLESPRATGVSRTNRAENSREYLSQ